LATKFTYKMRSGGKGMWGRGPALYKHNYKKKKIIAGQSQKALAAQLSISKLFCKDGGPVRYEFITECSPPSSGRL
jgi:hypothetical protein